MTVPKRLIAWAIVASAAGLVGACQLEQVMLGQWYTVRSAPQGTCPALDWHFVVDAQRSIGGYLDRDQFTKIGTLSGTLNPDDSFQMSVTQTDTGRKESVTGQFTAQYMTLALDGTWICGKQAFRIWLPRGLGGGGGGGGGG